MTVAVAHHASSSSRTLALQTAGQEAQLRAADLAVLHVVDSLDLDVEQAYRAGLQDEIDGALAAAGVAGVAWRLHLATAQQDVAGTILELARAVDAELLVIGARRRSPVGKALMGSVTQTLILQAELPVLVVKPPA